MLLFRAIKGWFDLSVQKIKNVDDFWSWCITKLSIGLRADSWYNHDQPYGMAGFLNDFASRIIGFATLRQLRVKNSKIIICIIL